MHTHYSFNYEPQQSTTTTTEPDESTTTATPAPTTTEPDDPATTVAPTSSVLVSPSTGGTVRADGLPATGSGSTITGAIAFALLVLGGGMVASTRRRTI